MSNKKNILFVTTYNPYLQRTGAHQRTQHLFEALRLYGNVDMLFFNLHDQDIPLKKDENTFVYNVHVKNTNLSKLKSCFLFYTPNIIIPKNKECCRIYCQTINKKNYDLVVFRYLSTAVMCGVKDYDNIAIDIDDIPWHNYYRMAQNPIYPWIKRVYFKLKYKGIKQQSLRIMSSCKLYYTANPLDSLTKKGYYLPNIPSIYETTIYTPTPNKNILFVGLMAFPPNHQGVDHFIKNIWPHIIKKYPDTSFYIAGKGTPEHLKIAWEKNTNIHVLGYVENLKQLYEKCFIVVSPIYSGAGTNIKVLEALAMKKICIISKFSLRGFDQHFTHKKNILVAHSDEKYIQLLEQVLENPEQYSSIAREGYQTVMRYYTTKNIQKIINRTLFH